MIRRFGLLASCLATAGLALAVALPAAAADPPVSGDPRATAYPGNAVDCDDANLPGTIIQVTYLASATHVTILSIPEGYVLTGVVVKGANAYNVYVGDVRTALHAPLNPGGTPDISHWFACGQPVGTTTTPTTTSGTSTTTTTTTTTGSTTSTAGPSSTTSSGSSTSGSSTSGVAPSTSQVSGGSGPGDDDDLASTGFSGRGLLVAGGGLLLIGAGLMLGVRASRRTQD